MCQVTVVAGISAAVATELSLTFGGCGEQLDHGLILIFIGQDPVQIEPLQPALVCWVYSTLHEGHGPACSSW